MANKDFIADVNTGANKAVALDFAFSTDDSPFLNFDKRADPRLVADLAPI
jgi:hypothetical protein